MNERIRELAEQAGIEFDDSFSSEPETIYYLKLSDFEKFAELIVQECAGICDDYGMPDGTSPTAIILSAAIKKRFGVRE